MGGLSRCDAKTLPADIPSWKNRSLTGHPGITIFNGAYRTGRTSDPDFHDILYLAGRTLEDY